MFSSDSDIKDIKEGGEREEGGEEGEEEGVVGRIEGKDGFVGVVEGKGSNESVNTLKNPSADNSAQVITYI